MTYKVEGPDQAWSWAVAFAAFVLNGCLSGISRANGLFYVGLIDTFGVSRYEANLPFTIRNAVRCFSGLFVGVIGQRYGPRGATVAGGIFATVGVVLCSIAPSIKWISLFWGVLHGLGVGFGNTLFQVVVNQYFLKYRSTASGIAFSGGCIGAFVFPVVSEIMLNHYGLSGTFLLTGGIMMHVVPAGLLIKEPPWARSGHSEKGKSKQVANKVVLLKKQQIDSPRAQDRSPRKAPNMPLPTKMDISVISGQEMKSPLPMELENLKNSSGTDNSGTENPAFMGSERDFNENRSSSQDKIDIASRPDNAKDTSMWTSLANMCCHPMFLMISLSFAAFVTLMDNSITVIVDYIKDKGFKEDVGKYLMSTVALGNFFGRIGFGWVTDKEILSISKYMIILQLVQGACFVSMPFFQSYTILMAIAVLYGVSSGANVIMYPILVARYLSNIQSLAIGCVSFISGMTALGIPFLIGYFRDKIGSYDGMFYIIGGLSLFVGICWTLEPFLMKLHVKINKIRYGSPCITT